MSAMGDRIGGGREAMLSEARKLAVDALYSEKGHFAAAARWRATNYWLGVPAALVGAIAGASILADASPVISGILALVGAALTALMTFLNPSERALQHHQTGVDYSCLRRLARQFAQIDFHDTEDAKLRERLTDLTDRLGTIQGDALPIPKYAHKKAYTEISGGSADYSDAELDSAAGPIGTTDRPPGR